MYKTRYSLMCCALWVHDLTPENPTDRVANQYSIKDFISPSAATVIEIKYVRDVQHGKHLAREMQRRY